MGQESWAGCRPQVGRGTGGRWTLTQFRITANEEGMDAGCAGLTGNRILAALPHGAMRFRPGGKCEFRNITVGLRQ